MKTSRPKEKHFFSEFGQDKYIAKLTDKKSVTKTLLEAGAFDPYHLSNSRHFIENKWRAVLVEPNPKHFKDLEKHYQNKKTIHLIPKLLSDGIYDSFLDSNKDSFTALWKEGTTGIPVKTTTIKKVLAKFKLKKLGVLFLDTEGTEDKILKKMLLDKIYPEIICVENHSEAKDFEKLLKHKYKKLTHIGFDDILEKKFDKSENKV